MAINDWLFQIIIENPWNIITHISFKFKSWEINEEMYLRKFVDKVEIGLVLNFAQKFRVFPGEAVAHPKNHKEHRHAKILIVNIKKNLA